MLEIWKLILDFLSPFPLPRPATVSGHFHLICILEGPHLPVSQYTVITDHPHSYWKHIFTLNLISGFLVLRVQPLHTTLVPTELRSKEHAWALESHCLSWTLSAGVLTSGRLFNLFTCKLEWQNLMGLRGAVQMKGDGTQGCSDRTFSMDSNCFVAKVSLA